MPCEHHLVWCKKQMDSMLNFIAKYENHPSIVNIKHKVSSLNDFSHEFKFNEITENDTYKVIKSLNARKSCGYDHLSAKFLKLGIDVISSQLTPIINKCINMSIFPDMLKHAQITPIFKKKNEPDKRNYRPVSVLTALSKIFERCISDQLNVYGEKVFEPLLTAYRKGHGCDTLLLKMVTEWKLKVDSGENIGILTTDLSSAFDCLPQTLLIAKLKAYNLSSDACLLISSYLHKRKQRTKLSNFLSPWSFIVKGVPQGSIIGPLAFNFFINDIFYVPLLSNLFNYADDNSAYYCHNDVNVIKNKLECDAKLMINWFNDNGMKANASKFQYLTVFSNNISPNEYQNLELHVDNSVIKCANSIKLLSLIVDNRLNFTKYVDSVCKKAGRQVNILKRLSKFLDNKSKINIYLFY